MSHRAAQAAVVRGDGGEPPPSPGVESELHGGQMSAEPAFPGTDLVESAFAEGYVGGLGTAKARLQAAQGRPVVLTLAAGIRPWRWAETRSAVGALREQGAVALSAAPVVAAWLVLSGRRPLAALIALASDPEPSVRIEALSGLARQGGRDPRLLDLAMRASRSSDPGERRAAAGLLASFGDQSAG